MTLILEALFPRGLDFFHQENMPQYHKSSVSNFAYPLLPSPFLLSFSSYKGLSLLKRRRVINTKKKTYPDILKHSRRRAMNNNDSTTEIH